MTLKEMIKHKGLTQTKLANLLGLDRTTIAKIVIRLSKPSFDTLVGMAKVLEVKEQDIIDAIKEGGVKQ